MVIFYWLTVILCCLDSSLAQSSNDSLLLFLLPLSGSYYGEGVANKVGAEIAMSTVGFVNQSYHIDSAMSSRIVVKFENTRCDARIERSIVAKYMSNGWRQVYVIGGACYTYDPKVFKLPVLLDILPQIIVHELPIPLTRLHNTFSLQPFQPAGFAQLSTKLAQRNITSVVLIHDNDIMFMQTYNSVLLEFRNYNIDIELAVSVIGNDGRSILLNSLVQIIEKAKSRTLLFFAELSELIRIFCIQFNTKNRFHLVTVVKKMKSFNLESIDCFGNKTFAASIYEELPLVHQLNEQFLIDERARIGGLSQTAVSLAHDATMMMIQSVTATNGSADDVTKYIRTRSWHMTSGSISFNTGNQDRALNLTVLLDEMGPSTNQVLITDQQVSVNLAVLSIVFIFVFVMVCYALGIIAFHLIQRKHKMIKLTSVALNVIISMATLLLGVALILNGVAEITEREHFARLLKSISFCLYPMPFSALLVGHWLKLFRIYKVFNVSVRNKRCIRDSIFTIWIVLTALLDLVMSVLIVIMDPITCSLHSWKLETVSVAESVHYQYRFCSNQYWHWWIVLLFMTKVPFFILCLIYAYRVKEIAVPSLKDCKPTFVALFLMLGLSMSVTPVTMEPSHPTISYGVPSVAYITAVMSYFSIMFVPKMWLLKNYKKSGDHALLSRPSFHDSFGKSTSKKFTEDRTRNDACCGCLGSRDMDLSDLDGTEACLRQEIQNLKQSVQERDRTIRELSDRLFFGFTSTNNRLLYSKSTDYGVAMIPSGNGVVATKISLSQSSRSPPSGHSGSSPLPVATSTPPIPESKVSEISRASYPPNRPPRSKNKTSLTSSSNSELGITANSSETSHTMRQMLNELPELNKMTHIASLNHGRYQREDPNNIKIGFHSSEIPILEDKEDDYVPSIILHDFNRHAESEDSSDLDELEARIQEISVELHDIELQEDTTTSDLLSDSSGSPAKTARKSSLVSNLATSLMQSDSIYPTDLRLRGSAFVHHSDFIYQQTAYSPVVTSQQNQPIASSRAAQYQISNNSSNTTTSTNADRYPSLITMQI